jgi:hypothetical protein
MLSFAGSCGADHRGHVRRRHDRFVRRTNSIARRCVIRTLLDDARLRDETVAPTGDSRDVRVFPRHFPEGLPEFADGLAEIVLLDGRIPPHRCEHLLFRDDCSPVFDQERGTGLGVWWRVPEGAFAAVTEAFLFNGGIRTGVQRITQEIEVAAGHEEFNASVTSEILDVSGNVVAAGCATSIGRRM